MNSLEEAQPRAQLADAQALNAKLRASRSPGLTAKVSGKGAISIYGLGRFPVTLYGEQWDKLIAYVPTLTEFLDAHRSELSTKKAA